MSKAILTDHDFGLVSRIQNLPPATASGQPVRFDEFNMALQGLAWKDDVVAASPGTNINLSAPGASVDGVSMAIGNRFLAKDQTDQTQNGIYVWNGASSPATRATDADTGAKLNAAVVPVDVGGTANSNTRWRITVANATIGTTAITFVADQTAAPQSSETVSGTIRTATQSEVNAGTLDAVAVSPAKLAAWTGGPKRYAYTFGDGSATSYTVTHNLNTEDVIVFVRETGGNKREVDCEVRDAGVNAVTLLFNSAPASGALRAIVTA